MPLARCVQLALQPGRALDLYAIDRNQPIPRLDARFRSLPIRIHPVSYQSAIMLHPPNAVIRAGELPLFLQIEARKHDRSHGQQEQQDRNKPSLAFPIHGFRRLPRTLGGHRWRGRNLPLFIHEQLRCHPSPHSRIAKSRRKNYFQEL